MLTKAVNTQAAQPGRGLDSDLGVDWLSGARDGEGRRASRSTSGSRARRSPRRLRTQPELPAEVPADVLGVRRLQGARCRARAAIRKSPAVGAAARAPSRRALGRPARRGDRAVQERRRRLRQTAGGGARSTRSCCRPPTSRAPQATLDKLATLAGLAGAKARSRSTVAGVRGEEAHVRQDVRSTTPSSTASSWSRTRRARSRAEGGRRQACGLAGMEGRQSRPPGCPTTTTGLLYADVQRARCRCSRRLSTEKRALAAGQAEPGARSAPRSCTAAVDGDDRLRRRAFLGSSR